MRMNEQSENAAIEVRDLTMMYDSLVIMEDLKFSVNRGEVFVIMGGSGSGKSTLLKHLIGLKRPAQISAARMLPRARACSGAWACCIRMAHYGAG
jgi:ABC-type transporter Mla maintaining outer membrane lipid asymmetry ATPase subunit MlaF